jgi:uncharacterized protein
MPKEIKKKTTSRSTVKKVSAEKKTVKKTPVKKSSVVLKKTNDKIIFPERNKFTKALKGKKDKPSDSVIAAALAKTEVKDKILKTESMSPQLKAATQETQSVQISHPPKPRFEEHYSLPSSYGQTEIVLVPRDPYWIYAYWEIDGSSIDALRKKIGDEVDRSATVMRLYEISFVDFNGTNANHWFDIDVGPFAKNWYINLLSDNASYCAELGLRTSNGTFYSLARSNFITLPRASSSHRSEIIWMEVKEEEPSAFVSLRTKGNGFKHRGGFSRRIYLTDEEIMAYYSRHFYLLKQILSRRLAKNEMDLMEEGSIGGVTFALDEILRGELTHKAFLRKIRSGSSEEMIVEEGASVREERKRKFFFEIGTELIVYGRTESDARVTLNGKEVKLRPDGTFSLRYVLHDGNIPLDFKAHSKNAIDKRSIKTSVERTKTEYKDNA